jgi:malonate transporter
MAIRASGYLPRELWRGVNALNHRVLLPSFLFSLLALAEFDSASSLALMAASGLGSVIMVALALGAGWALSAPGRERAPMAATAVMWNIVLTLALAQRLLGPDIASAGAAVAAAGVILGAAATVAGFALTSGRTLTAALGKTARDPVVLACVLGLAANLAGVGQAPQLVTPLQMIGAGSMAVILMAMGAGLDFQALKGRLRVLVAAAALRTLVGPVVYLGLALASGSAVIWRC